MKFLTLLPAILFLIVVSNCERTKSSEIHTCIINHADAEIRHINILFSGKAYAIPSLKADHEKCLVTPLYSEASYDIQLCIKGEQFRIYSMGYFSSIDRNTKVNIFLKKDSVVKNRRDSASPNYEAKYTHIGTCLENRAKSLGYKIENK